ncbi:MAG: glycine cleavage system protein GcvH [Chloroflexi bacterium]|nr:MAG: glycine cleavage system protein GcvH [Chloroflexota bacterium]
MNIPADLKYTKEDEWVKVEGNIATIGVTDYAQDALSDIVYLELPAEGDAFSAGEAFGVVESVKAASDLYMPIDGTVTEANEDLVDAPETVNSDPFGAAWLVKVEIGDPSQLDELMDADAYTKYCEERS